MLTKNPSWIFIIEGILTVCVGFMGYCLLVPFPDANPEKAWSFLNKREVDFIVARVNADRADVTTEPFNLVKFLRPGLDLKIWGFAMCFCCLTTVSYALAYFLPQILSGGMGFTVGEAQCLVAPPCKYSRHQASDFPLLTVNTNRRLRRFLHVRHRMGSRQIQDPRPDHRRQRHGHHHRPRHDGLGAWHPRAVRGSLLHLRGRQLEYPAHDELAGQQHPWPVEAGVLQCDAGCVWWYWRHCWEFGV
jgi:hypothetical protein